MMTELATHLGVFLQDYLRRSKGASRCTVESYACSFKLLVTFAANKHGIRPCELEVEQLGTQTILDFLESLENLRGNAVATRNARLAAIKSFFRFLEFREPKWLLLAGQVRALPTKKGGMSLIGHLDREQTRALLNAPDTTTRSGIRDRAMLGLAYNAGLRVSELVGLQLNAVNVPQLDEVRVTGKGRLERVLPLWKQTRCDLRAWLKIRPHVVDRHLFLNAMKTGMTRHGFAKRLTIHAHAAALEVPSIADKKITPHLLRHTCAIHTLKATGDIRKVSLWLGHASLQTTEMYLRADPTDKLETLQAWHSPGLRKGSFQGVQDQLLAMLEEAGI